MHARPDATGIVEQEKADCPARERIRDCDLSDVDDGAVSRHPFPDPVVVAPYEEATAVEACEDPAGAVLGASVAEVTEAPDRFLTAHGGVPTGDERLVMFLDVREGPVQSQARPKCRLMGPVGIGREERSGCHLASFARVRRLNAWGRALRFNRTGDGPNVS